MSAWPDLVRFIRRHRLEPTLTVYVEARPNDPAGERGAALRLRDALARLAGEMEGAPPFEKSDFDECTDDLIEALPGEESRSRSTGWGYFRAAGGDRLIVPVPVGIETSASWGTGPRVVPFLRVSRPQSALVVQVDREHARFSFLHDGIIEEIVSLEAAPIPVEGTHDDAQRQRREANDRFHALVVRRTVALSEDHLPVLVGGPDEAVLHLLADLPSSLEERSARIPDVRMERPESRLETINHALDALRELRLRRHVDALREDAHPQGRAAVGFDQALRAAERGAIAELIFGDSAWRAQPQAIELLVHRAVDAGATVEWAADGVLNSDAHGVDGIIAGLRFAVPKG